MSAQTDAPAPAATAATVVAAAGLPLDSRQRAMLQAMGIHVWEPSLAPEKSPPAHLNSEIAAATPTHAPTSAPTPAPAHSPPQERSIFDLATATAPSSAAPLPASAHNAVALQPLPQGIDSMGWLQLQSAVSTCQACALCASRKNTVFGIGQASVDYTQAPRADWLIVGEAPGENEDLAGQPFVGHAGHLLDNMLRAMVVNGQPLGRTRNVFIANVLKCRPPANRNPSPQEMAQCQPYLQRQIALLQPKIILAMGRFAVQSLLGSTEPLGKLRGRVHTMVNGSLQTPVIVTYHPAYLLRNLPDKAKAWADLLLAMETLEAIASGS
jgi:uracil-DNA glycosylase